MSDDSIFADGTLSILNSMKRFFQPRETVSLRGCVVVDDVTTNQYKVDWLGEKRCVRGANIESSPARDIFGITNEVCIWQTATSIDHC